MAENLLSSRDQTVIYLAASGKDPAEIAEVVGVTAPTIRKFLEDDRTQFEIKRLRHKLFGKDIQKRFKDMLPKAVDALEAILDNPNLKPHLHFQVGQEVLDRALGKPKQTVEHQGSLLKDIYQKLDGSQEPPIIDITPGDRPVREINPNETEEPASDRVNPNLDPIDAWAKENL